MNCFFSIIIPCYNRVAFLPKLLDGMARQTFADFEVLLVDDGSTDGTREYIQSQAYPFLRYIYQANAERSAARNNGISAANGTYLFFLDSDDTLPPDTLQHLHRAILAAGSPVAVFGTRRIYLKNGTDFSHEQFDLSTGRTAKNILLATGTVPVDQCAHRNCFETNRFDPRFTLWEDTHLWLRVLQQYPCIGVSEARIRVNIHGDSTVAQGLQTVRLQDVHRYRHAVLDLLQYPELFPKDEFEPILHQYVFAKYRMYIYQARINRQYDICSALLKEARGFGSDRPYQLKTGLKIALAKYLKIRLS